MLARLRTATHDKTSEEALKAVAHEMRAYAVERPALSAAAFRTTAADCPEWRAAHEDLHTFMLEVLSDCEFSGDAAEDAAGPRLRVE